MTDRPWKITYKDEPWSSLCGDKVGDGIGFHEITFEDSRYGFISKKAWDSQCTGDILKLVEVMLNDAHSLALKEHD